MGAHLQPLNARILQAIEDHFVGGGYEFTPTERDPKSPINPRDPNHDGIRHDLHHAGEVIARGSGGPTYCCGVSFEVVFRAWQAHAAQTATESAIGSMDADGVRQLVADWFCPVMGHPGAASALVEHGLGIPVAPDEAVAGDLCQFWRRTDLANPSGHSVVFLRWSTDDDGQRRIHYWSSQRSTDGVGAHSEVVGPGWTMHFARAVV